VPFFGLLKGLFFFNFLHLAHIIEKKKKNPNYCNRAYLTYCGTEKTLGFYSGVFFTLFILNQVLGNFSAAYLLDQNIETDFVFKILAAIAIFGLFIFLLLRPVSRPKHLDKEEIIGESKPQKPKILEVYIFSSLHLFTIFHQCFFLLIV